MRIAYFLADHGIPVFGPKGASVHVRSMAVALAARGHEVTVLCTKQGRPVQNVPFRVEKVSIPSLPPPDTDGDATPPARCAKERHYMATADALMERFLELHRQRPFDAIYERYSLWSAAGSRAARITGLPVVVEVNAPLRLEQAEYRELYHQDHARALEYETFSESSRLAVVSEALKDYVIAHGAREDRVAVIPNGYDPRIFHPRVTPTSLPETEGRTVIAFSGSLKAWHGMEILVESFRILCQRLAGVHLLIIGDGPMREWLRGYVRGAGLDDVVSFIGWTPYEEVPSFLACADIAVAPYPALDDFYFSPLKLFEYLAMGKPVVASALGQIETVLRHGRNGLLVPPGDPMALADALERLCLDEALRHRLARAAPEAVAGRRWEDNAREVEILWLQSQGTSHGMTEPR